MSEKSFQDQILMLARARGVAVYHTHDSRHSEAGYPDLTIVGEYGVIFRELKTERGKASPMQLFWMTILNKAGADAAIWRPSDWPVRIDGEMKALGRLTTARPQPTPAEVRRKLARKRVAG